MNQEDYYKMLQVDPDAEPEVIAAAYKRLAQKYHPDVQIGATEARRIQEINTAYEVLSNPSKRAQYDRMRSSRAARSTHAATPERFPAAAMPLAHEHSARPRQRRLVQAASRAWSVRRIILACVGIGVLVALGTAAVLIQPRPDLSRQESSIWEGECRAQSGYMYACRVRMKVSSTNRVTGSIVWSLKVSPHADEQLAIGRKARSSVKGTFDPVSRRITVGSYTQDDPYAMIDVDEYILWLSADGQTLSGETYDDGVWQGSLVATRKE